MGHRRGKGQILTANQLAELLAIPCFYILKGRAQPAFPESSWAGPSSFVQIVLTHPPFSTGDFSFFPVTVNWRQWKDVVVPILKDERWSVYMGSTGAVSSSTGGGIPTLQVGSPLYGGLEPELVDLLTEALRQRAVDCGWGSPDQEPSSGGSD